MSRVVPTERYTVMLLQKAEALGNLNHLMRYDMQERDVPDAYQTEFFKMYEYIENKLKNLYSIFDNTTMPVINPPNKSHRGETLLQDVENALSTLREMERPLKALFIDANLHDHSIHEFWRYFAATDENLQDIAAKCRQNHDLRTIQIIPLTNLNHHFELTTGHNVGSCFGDKHAWTAISILTDILAKM